MNLEQRVQALEQELALLKGQIQATLLDIQEQILNGTYPTLRGEGPSNASPAEPVRFAAPEPIRIQAAPEPMRPAPVPEPVRVVAQEPSRVVQQAPANNSSAQEPSSAGYTANRVSAQLTELEEPPAPVRAYKRVTITDPEASNGKRIHEPTFGEADNHRQAQPIEDEPITPPVWKSEKWDERDEAPLSPSASRDWIELENWVSQKVEKLGIQRTRELINVYTRQEHFSRQERELLLQFVSVYDGVGKSSAEAAPVSTDTQMVPVRPTIVPQTRAVVEELREELRRKHAQGEETSKVNSEVLSDHQELVMRLIAGILSAGEEVPAPTNQRPNGFSNKRSSNGHKKY